MPSISNLTTLKINYLTAEQYATALENNQINEDELYLTPASGRGSTVTITPELVSGTAVATITIDGAPYVIYVPAQVQANWNETNSSNAGYIQNKPSIPAIYFNTTAGWNAQNQRISELNAIYIYTDAYQSDSTNVPCIKVGDGSAYVIDLPFINKLEVNHMNNSTIHVTQADKDLWNSHVGVYYASSASENLVFYTGTLSL